MPNSQDIESILKLNNYLIQHKLSNTDSTNKIKLIKKYINYKINNVLNKQQKISILNDVLLFFIACITIIH
jgi:hypothetical protein